MRPLATPVLKKSFYYDPHPLNVFSQFTYHLWLADCDSRFLAVATARHALATTGANPGTAAAAHADKRDQGKDRDDWKANQQDSVLNEIK